MKDVIEIENEYYIRARSSFAEDRTRVLLQGDTFAVFDPYGDIEFAGFAKQGLFHDETRYLSRLALRIAAVRPLLLSSTIRDDNVLLSVDLTNPDLDLDSGEHFPRGTVHIYRAKFLWEATCFEEITIRNYGLFPVSTELTLEVGADFADIFEVRGTKRKRAGLHLPQQADPSGITLSYQGLDNVLRRTRIECSPRPTGISGSSMSLSIQLQPHKETVLALTITCESNGASRTVPGYDQALTETTSQTRCPGLAEIDIYTSNEQFNDWLNRSRADLQMMIASTAFGPYPYAGVPWFSTIFGRDGVITAIETLWMAPALAKGVLSYLASTQATNHDPDRDAEPGKILHETRKGEMADLGEVPFGRYYGSVDATPLFVLLAGAYYERTADLSFLQAIWPNIEAALDWIDRFGDFDADGFVEYARRSATGLIQQGWKDSHDSVFHADGHLAEGPIALCEVQAYVYAAKRGIAEAAADMGHAQRADELRAQAKELQRKFEESFWSDELSTYALALDKDKRQCRVRSSNAGQCLFSGIASEAHAQRTISTLLSPSAFSGWGVRTVAGTEARYNPMSYHNGSVWPHDNALIGLGVSHFQNKELALRIMSGLLDISIFVELHRLPELICGFSRRPGKGPTLYPVACAPQAWAAGAVFLLLQSCLGLSIRAKESRVYLHHTALPESLEHVRIRNLKIGQASIDLAFERHAKTVAVDVLRRDGDVEIVALA